MNLISNVLALPRRAKQAIVAALDVLLCVASVWAAFYLRLGHLPPSLLVVALTSLVAVLLAVPFFVKGGLYRAIFRYGGLAAMLDVARTLAMYGIIFAFIFSLVGVDGVPRTVGFIQPILLLLLVGASRAAPRVWFGELRQQRVRQASLPQALIYGAGSAGRQLAGAIAHSPELRVVGFLDDDDRLHGHQLNGLPIHGPKELGRLLRKSPITTVLLALPSVPRQRRNVILQALREHQLAVRTLPGVSEIAMGKVSLSDVRDLDIDDLLGREPVKPNGLLLNLNTHEKTVLVTGAGGSIGSELCRQIVKTAPRRLLLLELSEFALYQIHQELQGLPDAEGIELVPLLGSVCDAARLDGIMGAWKPQTVYHAAAYKHVPLVEHNPAEGVRNNVWGTRVCAEAALRNGVRNFVLVSTDKAVRPTNIMGATKRLAEMVLQALAEQGGAGARTCFSMVRFGNVLGSSGSVVPLFREQIKNGGPITLTHADITRYFMTIPEAAQLVIQAGAMGTGGDVFVLDMGQPIRIIDLARRMVELSGLKLRDADCPGGDIEIAITGLRPGEKLYEELLIGENPQPTQHTRIMKAHEQFLPWGELARQLDELEKTMVARDVYGLRRHLGNLVSGYQPSDTVVDWVYLATGSFDLKTFIKAPVKR